MNGPPDGLDLLLAAGWSSERATDVHGARQALEQEGYSVSREIERHLSNVDGVSIDIEHQGRPDRIWFDAAKAVDMTWKYQVDQYEEVAKVPLVPFGYAFSDHLALLLSEDGRVYGAFDDYFELLGNSIPSAVGNLVQRG
jgi:hypothetical protein